MKKHQFSQEHITEHYDEIAKKYDDIYLNAGYHDHEKCADLAAEHIPEAKRKEVEILDMGCGTGLVGQELKPKGFSKVVGIDVS